MTISVAEDVRRRHIGMRSASDGVVAVCRVVGSVRVRAPPARAGTSTSVFSFLLLCVRVRARVCVSCIWCLPAVTART